MKNNWSSKFWSNISTYEFKENQDLINQTIAILPLGATEQHGPHLSLNVDSLITDSIINNSLEFIDFPILILPTQNITFSVEHLDYLGTLNLNPETLIKMLIEIANCVVKTGIKKLLIFNSHGGNVSIMDIVARQLRIQNNLIVYHSSWFNLPHAEIINKKKEKKKKRFDIHAGEIETSLMLHIDKDLVKMENAENFKSSAEIRAETYEILGNGKSAKLGWAIQDYNFQGATGNAKEATEKKGRILLESIVVSFVKLLTEIYNLPLDTIKKVEKN